MLGECKLDQGPKYHCDGTTQVLGYCSGAEKRALCIGFCQKPNVDGRMKETRQHFTDPGGCHDVEKTKDHHLPWSFLGVHRHSSGTTVEVLHIACNLYEPDGMVADDEKEDEEMAAKKKAKKDKKAAKKDKDSGSSKKKSKKTGSPYGTAVEIMCKNPDQSKDKLVKKMQKKGFEGDESAVGTAYSCVRSIVSRLRANGLMEE